MQYKQYNDYELLYMVRENDEDSHTILFEKYQPLLHRLAREYYLSYSGYGCEYEDFLQEAYIAFQKAICSYKESSSNQFYTFALVCIRRNLITFCRNLSVPKKNIPVIYMNEQEESLIEDKKSDMNSIMNYVALKDICKDALSSLPIEVSSVLELRMNGFTYQEISKLLDIPCSTVESRFQQAKRYLQKEGVYEKA